jgi:hypothetical protein
VIDLASVNLIAASASSQMQAVPFAAVEREPAIVNVSRCAQAFLATTPSSPIEQACLNISPPSTSKLLLYWMSVSAMIFLRSALRSNAGSFRRLPPLYSSDVEHHGDTNSRWVMY